MANREKVIHGLQSIKTYLASQAIETTDSFAREGFIESQQDIDDALALLKEQEAEIRHLRQKIDGQVLHAKKVKNALYGIVSYAYNEGYKKGVKQVKSTEVDMVEVVRCKDCKHKVDTADDYDYESKCPCFCSGDPYYSWVPDDNWFCPKGERKEGA